MEYIKATIPNHLDEEEEETTSFLFSSSHIPNNTQSKSSSFSSSSISMSSYDPDHNSSLPTVNGDSKSNQPIVIPETAHQISTGIFSVVSFFGRAILFYI